MISPSRPLKFYCLPKENVTWLIAYSEHQKFTIQVKLLEEYLFFFPLSGWFLLAPVSVASSMISCCVLKLSLIVICENIPMEGQFFSAKPDKKYKINVLLILQISKPVILKIVSRWARSHLQYHGYFTTQFFYNNVLWDDQAILFFWTLG